jgi:hypothetical protein
MKIADISTQIDTTTAADTLSKSYDQKWEAMNQMDQAGPLMQFMASNDLIFVVLGVSLIIWLVLLTFLIRLDKKVGRLEQEIDSPEEKGEN